MRMPALILLLLGTLAADPLAANPVTLRWVDTLDAVNADLSSPRRARLEALAWAAAFNAVNACSGRFQPYALPVANRPADAACAAQPQMVAAAIHTVLLLEPQVRQAPAQKAFDDAMAEEKDAERRAQALLEGRRSALALLLLRAGDRFDRLEMPLPAKAPGAFALPAEQPQLASARTGRMQPFTRAALDALDPGPPPAVDSAIARRDLDELRRVGSADSRGRSADQTHAAIFWNSGMPADDSKTRRPWMAAYGADALVDALRAETLFAIVNVDSFIAFVKFQFQYLAWRPETALGDGWVPMLRTPPSGDHPSGTAVYAGAEQVLLERLPATAGAWPLKHFNSATNQTRRWVSAADMAREAGESRIWAGVHTRSAVEAGWKLGRRLAEDTLATQLLPR